MEFKPWDELENILPSLSSEEFESLKSSIESDGQMNDIFILSDGTIIDGHNRWKILGDSVKYKVLKDLEERLSLSEILEWAIKYNLSRRQLSPSQLDVVIKKLEDFWIEKIKSVKNIYKKIDKGEIDKIPQETIAEQFGVSQQFVSKYKIEWEKEESEKERLKEENDKRLEELKQKIEDEGKEVPKTKKDLRKELKNRESGENTKNITFTTGKSRGKGDKLLKKSNMSKKVIPRIHAGSKLNDIQKEDIYERSQKGETQQQIADDLKVAQSLISSTINNVQKRKDKEKEEEKLRVERQKDLNKKDGYKPILYKGDFKEICDENIENGYIDHIITDPPYAEEYLCEWKKLAETANRVLKPSGFCVCYSGTYHLDKIFNILSEELSYFWQCILLHTGGNQSIRHRNLRTRYKPILVFQKEPVSDESIKPFVDVMEGTGREKYGHVWQQAEDELLQIVEIFTQENDLILDPFCGSGTTGVVCSRLKRRSILMDINDVLKEDE